LGSTVFMLRRFRWFGSIGSGLALWACYPPLDAGWLVWVALVPLLCALWSGEAMKIRHGFACGYIAGVVFFLLTLQWLRHVHPVALLVSLYFGLYVGLWGAFAAALGPPRQRGIVTELVRLASLSACWTALEWLRGILFSGFGWNGLGVALHQWPEMARQAEWIGVTGLSFWIVLAQSALAALAMALARRPGKNAMLRPIAPAVVALLLVACLHAAPTWWLARGDAGGATHDATVIHVALVQPNIPQEVKNLPEEFDPIARSLARLTSQALDRQPAPKVIVWPESALPSNIDDPRVLEFVDDTLSQGEFVLVLGIDEQLMDRFFNSVAVARGSAESLRMHAKVQLVPFGEFLPARAVLGRIEAIRTLLPGDFDAGESTEPLDLPGTGVGMIPLVCFEDTIGRVARKFVRDMPQLIVNVTNDAWFKGSEEADQHLANAVFRCLELRRPMVRAANTGVTAIITAHGDVLHRLERLEQGVLSATVAVPNPGTTPTLFARHGDRFSQALMVLAAAGLVWVRARYHPPANNSGPLVL
jgi:apolipoprotein N-acyltransferase